MEGRGGTLIASFAGLGALAGAGVEAAIGPVGGGQEARGAAARPPRARRRRLLWQGQRYE